jgi:hypothetical protein
MRGDKKIGLYGNKIEQSNGIGHQPPLLYDSQTMAVTKKVVNWYF